MVFTLLNFRREKVLTVRFVMCTKSYNGPEGVLYRRTLLNLKNLTSSPEILVHTRSLVPCSDYRGILNLSLQCTVVKVVWALISLVQGVYVPDLSTWSKELYPSQIFFRHRNLSVWEVLILWSFYIKNCLHLFSENSTDGRGKRFFRFFIRGS